MQTVGDKDAALAKQRCLGLPWLWCVNCFYFSDKYFGNRASAGLAKWYTCSMVGAIVCAVSLVVWIATFQACWRDWAWAPAWMVTIPSEDASGW